jgi:hypothetical protein
MPVEGLPDCGWRVAGKSRSGILNNPLAGAAAPGGEGAVFKPYELSGHAQKFPTEGYGNGRLLWLSSKLVLASHRMWLPHRKRSHVQPPARELGSHSHSRECCHCQSGGGVQSNHGWLFKLWTRAPPTYNKNPANKAISRTADRIGQTCIFPHSEKGGREGRNVG